MFTLVVTTTAIIVPLLVFFWCFLSRLRPTIDPRKKIVLVTGAASGIGKEICLELASRGSIVVATDLKSEDELKKIFDPLVAQGKVICFRMDVTKKEDIDRVAEKVKVIIESGEERRLFGLVNNAGIGLIHPCCTIFEKNGDDDLAEAKQLIDINLFGSCRCVKTFYPLLTQNKKFTTLKESSSIINIASIAGRIAPPFWSWYPCSKSALIGYTDTLRREVKSLSGTHNYVRVTAVLPGFTDTPILAPPEPLPTSLCAQLIHSMVEKVKKPLIQFQKPGVVAKIICDCLFSLNAPPHYVIETKYFYRILWFLISTLPAPIADTLISVIFF